MKKGGIVHYPFFQERAYAAELLWLANDINKKIVAEFVKNESFVSAYNELVRADDATDEIESLINSVKSYGLYRVLQTKGKLANFAKQLNFFNKRSVANSLASLSQTFDERERNAHIQELLSIWVKDNVRLITSIPTQITDKLSQVIYEAVQSGKTLASLTEQITKIHSISENRAKLIARTETAKLNSALTRYRNQSVGIYSYMWITGRDERVRPNHAVLESKVCDWSDSFTYKNSIADTKWKKRSSISATEVHVGFDINCRCTSAPVF